MPIPATPRRLNSREHESGAFEPEFSLNDDDVESLGLADSDDEKPNASGMLPMLDDDAELDLESASDPVEPLEEDEPYELEMEPSHMSFPEGFGDDDFNPSEASQDDEDQEVQTEDSDSKFGSFGDAPERFEEDPDDEELSEFEDFAEGNELPEDSGDEDDEESPARGKSGEDEDDESSSLSDIARNAGKSAKSGGLSTLKALQKVFAKIPVVGKFATNLVRTGVTLGLIVLIPIALIFVSSSLVLGSSAPKDEVSVSLPANLGELLAGYENVVVPEMNTGQLKTVLRDQYLIDAVPLNKVSGQPFAIGEIEEAIAKFFDSVPGNEGGEVFVNEGQLPSPEAHND